MKIILIGPGSGGKSTLFKSLAKRFPVSRSVVTRPMRPGEINGDDYNFISVSQFLDMKERGMFIQAEEQKPGEWYGTLLSDLLDKDVFILTPQGLKNLEKVASQFVTQAMILYLNPQPEILAQRLGDRNDGKSTERFNRDQEIFKSFSDWDIELTEWKLPISQLDRIINTLREICEKKMGEEISPVGDLHFYNTIGMDSLDYIEFVMEVEKEYNITITDQEAESMRTIPDMAKFIQTNYPHSIA